MALIFWLYFSIKTRPLGLKNLDPGLKTFRPGAEAENHFRPRSEKIRPWHRRGTEPDSGAQRSVKNGTEKIRPGSEKPDPGRKKSDPGREKSDPGREIGAKY